MIPTAPAVLPSASPPAIAPIHAHLRRITVSDLLAGKDEVILLHDSQEYRLRKTRANKLILTK